MSNRTAQHTPPAAPPRYKLALVTWAGAYGAITLIIWLLGPTMAGWPLVLRTLLISVLMVNALTWVVLPALTRLFRAWLLAATPGRLAVEVSDDGVGGADIALGTGLRGLSDRLAAINGQLGIDLNPGHGTTLRASIPCPSPLSGGGRPGQRFP